MYVYIVGGVFCLMYIRKREKEREAKRKRERKGGVWRKEGV